MGCKDFTLPPAPAPTPSPTPIPRFSPSAEWDTTTSVDILVAALFLIAAGWLVLAIIYSVLILVVVRMRARGELDIYDANFGRIFLLGGRCFIPLGCLLRRHVVALNRRNHTVRLMTREERRSAMEELLTEVGNNRTNTENTEEGNEERRAEQSVLPPTDTDTEAEAQDNHDDIDTNGEPICSICLMEYENDDVCFTSRTCVHKFHRDCLMDWLERRNHTECPCCREPMVADDDVWDTVQQMRRQQRKLRRRQTRGKGLLGLLLCEWSCCCRNDSSQEGVEIDGVEEGNLEYAVELATTGDGHIEEEASANPVVDVDVAVPFAVAEQEDDDVVMDNVAVPFADGAEKEDTARKMSE
eukprot:CAMPEP_0119015714 /NCGR_PEP_ID=MMETSP1176-20130426/11474_1 /TAXON_ID=265551 /ORGANISM="Synedropsis recta cf, Strain CCMP1620" /LENGTH=355 /DNA_ID=CAMNT_0006969027 /DNA_START=226 /DNA_END=1293 /DNA_ORIENTATION=+